VIAVDTNILVYAHRADSAHHTQASAALTACAQSRKPWCIPWPCVHEFFAVVTHPRIYSPPTPPEKAMDQISAWLESPSLVLLGETDTHWLTLQKLLGNAKTVGPAVHDARIAALCLQHGVRELWSADRDFRRWPELKVVNPLGKKTKKPVG
jgi:toxin-antitoxin system PIN domain toxin